MFLPLLTIAKSCRLSLLLFIVNIYPGTIAIMFVLQSLFTITTSTRDII